MSCLLPLIAGACLMDPQATALSMDASRQLSGDFHYWSGQRDYRGATVGLIQLTSGGDLTRSVSLTYGVRHTSLLDTRSDRGENRFFVGLSWRPFR